MSEFKSYICPNCGANTTNSQNCDYCGSLLVRFVEKKINLSQTTYLDNTQVLPGLIKHLEQNLLMQDNGGAPVTDICWEDEEGECSICVLTQGNAAWYDDTHIRIDKSEDGLLIVLGFSVYRDLGEDYYELSAKQLNRFKNLASFELFTPHISIHTDDDGEIDHYHEYAIYFGHDVEGAARIISDILVNVYEVQLDDSSIEIYTNEGDAIDECRNLRNGVAVDANVDDSEEESIKETIIVCIIGIIIINVIWSLIFEFSVIFLVSCIVSCIVSVIFYEIIGDKK